MARYKKQTDDAVETQQELDVENDDKKDTGTDLYANQIYASLGKIQLKRFTGDRKELPEQKFDSKGKALPETKLQLIQRSRFIGVFVNGKYKIIMIYRGRGGNKHHALFDMIDMHSKANRGIMKRKYNFYKKAGIIF